MAFKVIVFAALVAVVRGGVVAPVAPVAHVAVAAKVVDAEYDPHPQYTFAYDVKDSITGDFKSQVESRDGEIVRGQYSVLDADGTKRIVDYTADPVNGFNAVVSRAPVAVAARVVAPAPVVAHAPVVAPAPVIAKFTPHAHVAAPVVARAPVLAKYAVAPHAHLAGHAHLAPAPLAYTAHSHFH